MTEVSNAEGSIVQCHSVGAILPVKQSILQKNKELL